MLSLHDQAANVGFVGRGQLSRIAASLHCLLYTGCALPDHLHGTPVLGRDQVLPLLTATYPTPRARRRNKRTDGLSRSPRLLLSRVRPVQAGRPPHFSRSSREGHTMQYESFFKQYFAVSVAIGFSPTLSGVAAGFRVHSITGLATR
jgi:hypothetical protein